MPQACRWFAPCFSENAVISILGVLYSGNGITIKRCLIAANAPAPVNHAFMDRNSLICEQGFQASRGGIVIEDDVWIGANCVLLDGAVLRACCGCWISRTRRTAGLQHLSWHSSSRSMSGLVRRRRGDGTNHGSGGWRLDWCRLG